MKQITTKLTFCLIAFLLATGSTQGQQFQWVKGGGTSEDLTAARLSEAVYFMCTDPNGNTYALSVVGNNPIYADTFYRASGAYGANNNLMVTSYTCNGQMRWAKLLASSGSVSFPYGITADSLGHIYVAGRFGNGGVFHIGYDTSISPPSSNYLSTGLIQFDTSGQFKWIRYIGANTFTSLLATGGTLENPIAVDGSDNIHYFCYLGVGVPLVSGSSPVRGVYDMEFNSSGTALSSAHLVMDSAWFLRGAVIDPVTNKLYAYGEINQGIYGGTATDTFFAAAFDASRNLLWQYFCGHGDDDGFTGIVMDESKHLYFSGAADDNVFSFHGDSVVGTSGGYLATIMKTDTNGVVHWLKHFDEGSTSINYFSSIALLPNYRVVAVGTFAGTVTDGTVSLSTPSGEGYSPYLVILDSGKNLQTIQQIHGDGFYNFGNAMASDKVGNIYVGGQVADSIFAGVPPVPAYHTVGGNTDFFVIKYGVDCSCTSAPTASYTLTGAHTINTTYTGTTTGLDSVVWNFGDGSTAIGNSATHTYSDTGIFTVCVTVYTECGSDIHCSEVRYEPSLMAAPQVERDLAVYPNPANDELNITGVQQSINYRLLSVTGICVSQGILPAGSSAIPMQKFVPGVYILEMTGRDGYRDIVRVVKE